VPPVSAAQSLEVAHTQELAAVVVAEPEGKPDDELVPVIAPIVGADESVNTRMMSTWSVMLVPLPEEVVVTVRAADDVVVAYQTSTPPAVPVPPVELVLEDFRPFIAQVRPPLSEIV
jgi:hypothetical protein